MALTLSILLGQVILINGQFSNFFAQMMNNNGLTGSGTGTNQDTGKGNSNCITASVSCLPAPWCKRTVDGSGCPKCDCGSGGFSSMMSGGSGKGNVISGGSPSVSNMFTSMLGGGAGRGFPGFPTFGNGKGPMNPMAMMFGSGSMLGGGGGSPMGMNNFPNPMMGQNGGHIGRGTISPSQTSTPAQNSKCGPVPYTCPVPPPWCQRVVDMDGCVKCYCGQKLQEYLQNLQGLITTMSPENETTTSTPKNSTDASTVPMASPEVSTTTTTSAPPLGMSCLANFMCTLTCDNGYQTADDGCPLCKCIDNSPSQTTTDNPNSIQLPTDGSIITCPGIFDCQKMCMNGFQTDNQGCPLCQCLAD